MKYSLMEMLNEDKFYYTINKGKTKLLSYQVIYFFLPLCNYDWDHSAIKDIDKLFSSKEDYNTKFIIVRVQNGTKYTIIRHDL